MGWIGCVRCEKFQRDFVPRTVAPVDPFCTECCRAKNGPKCTQIVWNAPKHEFRVQWGGSGVFVAKIPTRLRGTNFCTSLTRFALSVVWQPKSPKCTQIVRNTPKREFRVQWVRSGASSWKIPMRLRGMNFCTTSARSAPSFIRQPNSPKCTKIVQIARKQKFSVQWGGSGAFVAKNSNATLWHEQLHQLTRFALSVVGQKTVPNAPK